MSAGKATSAPRYRFIRRRSIQCRPRSSSGICCRCGARSRWSSVMATISELLLRDMAARGFTGDLEQQVRAVAGPVAWQRNASISRSRSYYYFPELPQVQFYETSIFPWLEEVEARDRGDPRRMLAVMNEPELFGPTCRASLAGLTRIADGHNSITRTGALST